MLQRLVISNYALISSLDMSLHDGMTSITGETGAGKSILLGAIGLILGQRADTSVISEHNEKCVIEGHFNLSKLPIKTLFDKHDLDFDIECIFRREITQSGKSRAFINDTPVTLATLKEIGQRLVEIQTQHTTLLMAQPDVQRDLIDSFISDQTVLEHYKSVYSRHKAIFKELNQAKLQLAESIKEKDYNEFLFQEIDQLKLILGEENTIETEINILTQASEIKERFALSVEGLRDGDINARGIIGQIIQAIKSFEHISPRYSEFIQRLKSISIEIEDLSSEALNIVEDTEENPERLFELNERFDKLQHLFRKHHVNTCEELLQISQNLESQIFENQSLEQRIKELEEQLEKETVTLNNAGLQLHECRKNAALELADRATNIVKRLNMQYAQVAFNIIFQPDGFTDNGADIIQLLFSSNPGIKPQNVSEIASGGELSRLNFAFRSIVSEKKLLPTLIYDEADTGISGEVAAKMGELFKELGQRHQVLCITHLPQVAAAGDHQWEVKKLQNIDNTETQVTYLNKEQRALSIAKMLSGSQITEVALAQAAHLLGIH